MKHYQMPLKTCVSFIDQIIPRNMSIIYCKTTWSKMNDFERKQYVRKITNKNEWTFVSNVWSVEVHSASLRLKRKPVSVNSVVFMIPEDSRYREEENRNSKCTQVCRYPFNFKENLVQKNVIAYLYSKDLH